MSGSVGGGSYQVSEGGGPENGSSSSGSGGGMASSGAQGTFAQNNNGPTRWNQNQETPTFGRTLKNNEQSIVGKNLNLPFKKVATC